MRRLLTGVGRIAAALALICVAAAAGAQEAWNLGRYRMVALQDAGWVQPLRVAFAPTALRSASFLSRVGGVAFSAEAVPEPSLGRVGSIDLTYDNSQSDGARLRVVVDGVPLTAGIPDWVLVPVARFANSQFQSVVSLFGPLSDSDNFHAVYHPAMRNTLLGLRMLHADMLLIDPEELWDLPRRGTGAPTLGYGERAPDRTTALSAARTLGAIELDAQSWVLTDADERIAFSHDGSSLRLSGSPYYYFWRDPNGRRADSLYAAALAALPDTIRARRLMTQAKELSERPQSAEPVPGATAAMKERRAAIRTLNPAVFDAATVTMRYAAFFRYCKRRWPAMWDTFHTRVSSVNPTPRVVTPTQVPR